VAVYGHTAVARKLASFGSQPVLRLQKGGGPAPFVTDNGNYIYDCRFPGIDDARAMEARIDSIPGVVECGIFARRRADVVLAGADAGVRTIVTPV